MEAEDPHKTASALSEHLPLKQLPALKALLFLLPRGVSTCWSPFPKGGCSCIMAFLPCPREPPPCCASTHISCLLATPSPYSRGSRCSTVTLPLSLPSPSPAWLNAGARKCVLASAVPCLQINSVTPLVKYRHSGEPGDGSRDVFLQIKCSQVLLRGSMLQLHCRD